MNDTYTDILLIGGGHSHLKVLYLAKNDKEFLAKITLVSNDYLTFYSGMISSWFEGIYSEDEITIDVRKLCNSLGVKFILGEVTKSNPKKNQIFLLDKTKITYNLASYDIGSLSATDPSINFNCNTHTIKPFNNLKDLKKLLLQKPNGHYAIIGSGISSIEITGAIASILDNKNGTIDLITKDKGLMPNAPSRLQYLISIHFKKHTSISIKHQGTEPTESVNKFTASKSYDSVIWAIGPKAHSLFFDSNFSTDNKGYMIVSPNLKSTSFENIWGAGDCVNVSNLNLKKNGVNAIREANTLYFNLKNSINNKNFKQKKYKPRKWQLAIYNMGNQLAIFHYGPFMFAGKFPWIIKNRIDKKYMNNYKKLYKNK